MGRLSDLMILNFLWIIFSLPIITIGASTAALYKMMFEIINNDEGYIIKSFYKAFRENLKKGIFLWISIIAVSFVLIVNLLFWIRYKNLLGYFSVTCTMFMIFIFLITSSYVFPVLSKSQNGILNTIRDSFILSMKYLPYSLGVITITGLFIIIPVIVPLSILFMIFIGFSFCALFNSYLIRIVLK